MAKVRVPKELRPPERFKPFRAMNWDHYFKVTGAFRTPRRGEFYYSAFSLKAGPLVHLCSFSHETCPSINRCVVQTAARVILERVQP